MPLSDSLASAALPPDAEPAAPGGDGRKPPVELRFAAATQAHLAGDPEAALPVYADLLRETPNCVTLLRLLGAGLAQGGDYGQAQALLRVVLELDPDDAEAHYTLGTVHANQGRLAAAVASFNAAIRLKPAHVEAARHLCRALGELSTRGGPDAAADTLPTPAAARAILGSALSAARRSEEALAEFVESLRLDPGRAETHHGYGWALADSGRLAEAESEFRTAIALAPDLGEAYINLGNVLREGRRFDEAEAIVKAALRRRPNDRRAKLNLGLLYLLLGRFDAGWPLYEDRWSAVASRFQPQPGVPFWRGDADLAGKRILLFAEQGLGDTLQFVRYAPLVGVLAAEVWLEVPAALTRLLAGLPGVTAVIDRDATRPAMDLRAPLLSLPLAFRTDAATIPAEIPYLAAPPDRVAAWAVELAPHAGLRVGLAWSGNPQYADDRKRSLALATLAPLLALPGIRCFVVQRDIRAEDRTVLAAHPDCVDLSARLTDFAETAAVVANLDLVIAADTSIAHLAGALGRPLWLLLPQVPDWRWLLDRDDSPWYPGARLFRQHRRGDWPGVVERVVAALHGWHAAAPEPLPPGAMAQALALHRQGQLPAAKALYRRLLAADPEDSEARHMLGVALAQQNQLAQALPQLQRAAARPSPRLLANLGNVLDGLGRHEAALECFERALALEPDAVDVLNGRGIALQALDRLDAALASFERALALRPDFAEAWHNRGTVLRALNRCPEALACCREARRLQPGYLDAGYNEGILDLLLGDYAAGLPLYEWRPSRRPGSRLRRPEGVEWLGDGGPGDAAGIAGRTVLLYAEQGYGDSLQFCRYAALVAARGARVILLLPAALQPLVAGIAGAAEVLDETRPLPPWDLQCPLPSLPLACGTRLATIPAELPYLRADPARVASWRQRLGPRTSLRVGLAWSGNEAHRNDARRSLAAAALAPLFELPLDFVCLQRELRPADRDFLAGVPRLREFSAAIADFADSAALLECVDLVVSVDTAIAHLAGALARPLWLLLPFAPDWRWLLARDDSPWYPTARLFRQAKPGDWGAVIERVAAALAGRSGAPPRPASNAAPVDPAVATALFDAGNRAWAEGRHEAALAAYDSLLAMLPEQALIHDNRGVVLRALGCDEAALASFARAVELAPDHADALAHLGIALVAAGRGDEAVAPLEAALAQTPDRAELLAARGAALYAVNRRADAAASYRAALAQRPDDAQLRADLALCLLGQGDFAAGWAEYESRLGCAEVLVAAAVDCPPWRGDGELAGRTLLLRAEQGLGDTLQFSRYLPLLAARGARVLLQVQPPLLPLFAGVAGVAAVFAVGEPLPPADLQCPLLSLPLAFATRPDSIPPPLPGLSVEAQRRARWRARLGPPTRPRIGLVWSGNPGHRNDRRRSLPLAALAPLLALPAEFVCLQREIRAVDLEALAAAPQLREFSAEIADFADTAALIEAVDLVLSIDSAVAHLAATLGRPTWILLPFAPDWRWLLERADSPWYPAARLFRQPAPGAWAPLLAQVAAALAAWLGAAAPGAPAAAQDALAEALNRHRQGDFAAAESGYRQRLAARPDDFDALQLLATVQAQQGRPAEALAGFDAALALQPAAAAAWMNRGNALQALGRLEEAVASFDRALALRPDHADCCFNRGNALQALGRFDAALAAYERALAIRPAHAAAWREMARLRQRQGRPAEALDCLDRLGELGQPSAADWLLRAGVLQQLERLEDALAACDAALALRPDDRQGHARRGQLLLALRRYAAAVEACDAALALAPDDAAAANNRGLALIELGRWSEAVASFDRALAVAPDFAGALSNRGRALLAGQRYAEALASTRAALALEPDFALAQFNAGLLCLLLGDFANGWAGHEWRFRAPGGPPPRNLPLPPWRGDSAVAGRRLLVHAEQGYGDTLQFVRYAPLLQALGATVQLELPPPLLPLFADYAGADAVLGRGEPLPASDCEIPMMSLPLAFATRLDSIPAAVPYLGVPPARLATWRQQLPPQPRLRVGLAWSGNPRHADDARRSLPLAALLPLLEAFADIDFFVVQPEIAATERALLAGRPQLQDLSGRLADFADTAAVLACLDLLIAVDTAVVHLAGALGRPAWVLLPAVPDWRWLLDRDDSPWYPSLRLFRQPAPGDWAGLLASLRRALAEWRAQAADRPGDGV